MLKVCGICGKGPQSGKSVVRKGLEKKKGGTGSKIVRTTKRKFLPNLQRVRLMMADGVRRMYVCAKCLKKGNLQKA